MVGTFGGFVSCHLSCDHTENTVPMHHTTLLFKAPPFFRLAGFHLNYRVSASGEDGGGAR